MAATKDGLGKKEGMASIGYMYGNLYMCLVNIENVKLQCWRTKTQTCEINYALFLLKAEIKTQGNLIKL